jgi:hypothetical protein
MRYSDMELYGPKSRIYRHAVYVRTGTMAILPPLILRSLTQCGDSDMKLNEKRFSIVGDCDQRKGKKRRRLMCI